VPSLPVDKVEQGKVCAPLPSMENMARGQRSNTTSRNFYRPPPRSWITSKDSHQRVNLAAVRWVSIQGLQASRKNAASADLRGLKCAATRAPRPGSCDILGQFSQGQNRASFGPSPSSPFTFREKRHVSSPRDTMGAPVQAPARRIHPIS